MGTVAVHVVPRARTTAILGPHGDAVKIRVAAPPEAGAANVALRRFLATLLRVPAHRVTITHGTSGRRKTIAVQGIPSHELKRALLETGQA